MSDVDRIAKMLDSEAIEKKIAAAIVLGEIKAKGPKTTEGLRKLMHSDVPPVAKHAIDALARIGARRHVKELFPLLTVPPDEVRQAAARAIASVGADVVPTIRQRMTTASAEERRALDAILAELGGEDAFSALLAGLDASDEDAAKAAALAVRHEVKRADAKQRRRYVAQTEKFLKQKKDLAESARAAAVKILGYLEDERAVPTLVALGGSAKTPASVRQEALIALRFTAPTKNTPTEVLNLLLDVAEGDDRPLAQAALHTLSTMEFPPKLLKRLIKLANHSEIERASIAIEQLGRRPGVAPAEALVEVLAQLDRRRAELAAGALAGRNEAAPGLAKALLAAKNADRAWLIRNTLRPFAKDLKPAALTKLRDAALAKLAAGERGWEAEMDIARDGNAKAVSTALRELGQKLHRSKKTDRSLNVWRLLSRSEHAEPEDLYRLASLELGQSRLDTQPAARATDDGLRLLSGLLDRGFDVAAALRKDRSMEPAMLYYVGFHFSEARRPLGEELLKEVVKKGGRTKIAKMAKNKLALSASDGN